jgi:hypothetical protein|tara:strand:+ start:24 stop:281 length:258 start_codon:yes stop_codon:yes gene_type:complete
MTKGENMSDVKLRGGDSAIIIRHNEEGYDMEIYHKYDRNLLTEEDSMYYALLTRGMVHNAITDPDQTLEDGRHSFEKESKEVTRH